MMTEAPTLSPSLPAPSEAAEENYLSAGHTVASWLLTTDHKRIGLLYLFSILVFFTIAAVPRR